MRDKMSLLTEFINMKGGTGQMEEVAFYKYKNELYNGLVERNARIKGERANYAKEYNARKKLLKNENSSLSLLERPTNPSTPN